MVEPNSLPLLTCFLLFFGAALCLYLLFQTTLSGKLVLFALLYCAKNVLLLGSVICLGHASFSITILFHVTIFYLNFILRSLLRCFQRFFQRAKIDLPAGTTISLASGRTIFLNNPGKGEMNPPLCFYHLSVFYHQDIVYLF